MIANRNDIKKTSAGYRVEKKVAGQPRLRKTFATEDEAFIALEKYINGNGIVETASKLTWRSLWELTKKKRWERPNVKSTTQMDNAERIIRDHLGWDNDVRDFDQELADTLYENLVDSGMAYSTIDKYNSAIRTMLEIGIEFDKVVWKTPKLIHNGSVSSRINYFEYEQEDKIINILRQTGREDLASLFIVFIETGMRTAEGMYLPWRDVDLDSRMVRLWGDSTKTGKDRRIVLTDRAYNELISLKTAQENDGILDLRVFPEATKSRLRSAWNSIRSALGNLDKDFVWYTTRHTCASRLMRAGVDIKTIQEMMGHKRLETTMRYIQFSEGSLATAAASLDNLRTEKSTQNDLGTAGTELSQVSNDELALLKKLMENKELVEKLMAA